MVVTIIEREEEESVTVEADAGADRAICLGDEVTLTATGGDSYQWSTGETTASITVVPEQTTTYAVTVSIGEVTDTAEVNVEVQEVVADAGPDQEIELGETVTLTATGGDSYEWSTGETAASIEVSPESTTTYSVAVQKGSCSATDEVVVTIIEREEEESVTVEADAGADRAICLGDEVTLTATGGDSYQWSTGETTASITVVPEQTTTYAVTVSIGEVTDTAEVKVEVQE